MKNQIAKYVVPALLLSAVLSPLAASAAPVNHRLRHQHARIEQGERSGRLTDRQADRLEARDARIHHQEFRDRHDGGGLSVAERRHLNHELNRTSRTIYREKHNH